MIAFWGSTFKSKPIDETLARTFATKYAVPLDLSTTHPPSEDDYAAFLKRAKESALGKNGVRYRCWHHAGPAGYRTLKRAQDSMMCGTLPPDDFNSSLGIFLPKGSADDDTTTSVNRTADNTRPIGLKTLTPKL